MPASDSYRAYVLEQLERTGRVAAKNMFGGVGLYLEGLFFALIADDTLYFKVDDSNRADFEAAGKEPFKPYRDKPQTMQYYEVPEEVLENSATLQVWARAALAVAKRKSLTNKK